MPGSSDKVWNQLASQSKRKGSQRRRRPVDSWKLFYQRMSNIGTPYKVKENECDPNRVCLCEPKTAPLPTNPNPEHNPKRHHFHLHHNENKTSLCRYDS